MTILNFEQRFKWQRDENSVYMSSEILDNFSLF